MRYLLLLFVLFCACDRSDVAELRAEVAALKAERDALKPGPAEVAPYIVGLPGWMPLGGLYRPLGVDGYPTGDEVCFEAKPAAQWFSALNRALGGKR